MNYEVGQVWYDTSCNEIKMWDGVDWITMSSMPYTPDPYYKRATFKRKFAFLPHRCYITDRLIWLRFGMRGQETEGGWAGSLTYYRWFDEGEFLVWYLKMTA